MKNKGKTACRIRYLTEADLAETGGCKIKNARLESVPVLLKREAWSNGQKKAFTSVMKRKS
jgi:hypothetical protein